jgi:hypothetical protein
MEVLIATFILAIGLVAIMALFPIGAVNMARAINQDRSATHGVNSDAMFRYYWKQAWNNPNGGTVRASSAEAYINSQEPVLMFLQAHPTYGTIPPTSSQPSFPVLVDSVGYLTKTGNDQVYVAGTPIFPVRTTLRRCVNYPAPSANPIMIPGYSTGPFDPTWPALPQPYPSIVNAVVRLTTLQDDMSFAKPNDGSIAAVNGEPTDSSGQIDRGGRYNAAWLIQRPRNDVPAEANVTVLVYAGRSPTDTPSAETAYQAVTQPGAKSIVVNTGAGQAPPALRRGMYVGFSMLAQDPTNPTWVPYFSLDFYRISGINNDNPNAMLLDVETPIKTLGPATGGNYAGFIVVFDNLVEVFDRGTVSATGVTGP